ncbi:MULTISPECIES: DUF3696 domain-containing protein [unclassified Streptomyces]|uniref:AAA family ATPase n=1 Tax=unclassified Streptomyces TaxID=2593676 RepID=UPI00215606BF|nr:MULTISPECIES: DUF3696 domain-containing protein [unclassified Streptomyces]
MALTNFKAFSELELRLGPLTLLTGLNSSGKSSVLQALALLHQSHTSGNLLGAADLATAPPAEDRRPSAAPPAGLLLNGELVGLGTGRDVLHEDFVGDEPLVTIAVDEGELRYAWTARYEAEQNLLPLVRALLPVADKLGTSGEAGVHPSYFTRGFQYLHADRISPAEFYPRDHQTAVGRRFLGTKGEHTINYLRQFGREEVPEPLRHRNQRDRRLLQQAAAWIGELCPGIDLQAHIIDGTDQVRLSYGFDGPRGTRRRPTNVGFGLTYALPVVVACLTSGPGSLLLLENPEAHLHPRGQTGMALLAAASAANGAQVVMETHSDHVLNGLRLAVKRGRLRPEDAVLHYFRHDQAGSKDDHLGVEVVSPAVDREGRLDQWPHGFFDELENTLDQLLS